jgi:voltage-gated potassium channel
MPGRHAAPVGDAGGGAIIVSVRDADGQFAPQPPAETMPRAGDIVLAAGTERTMERLEACFAPSRTRARS